MCYTGRCPYENHMGGCDKRAINIKRGLPADYWPDDACSVFDGPPENEPKSTTVRGESWRKNNGDKIRSANK